MLLGTMIMLPVHAVTPAELKIIDPVTGSSTIRFSNNDPAPTAPGFPLGFVTVNVSVFNVSTLAVWQIHIKWNASLLRIEDTALNGDMSIPTSNIFGSYPDPTDPAIDNALGKAFWVVGLKTSGPSNVSGSGTLCQIRFNVTLLPTPAGNLTTPLHFIVSGEEAFFTKLIDPDSNLIPYNPTDGTYKYEYETPQLKKPRLKVVPSTVQKGTPIGQSIIDPPTPKRFFQVDIVIEEVENASMLTLIEFAFKYKVDLFRLVPQGINNATEGNFMNKTAWAPYGTDFFTIWGGATSGIEKQYVIVSINPNSSTGEFDWGNFPDTGVLPEIDRVICTFYFEATRQDETPWIGDEPNVFDIDYMFPAMPDRMFLNAEDEWMPGRAPVDGSYKIYGWMMGLKIDVYTQYVNPYGGQDINNTSDMFFPQGTVILKANLTYNGDPVQNKPVTFQVWNEQGFVNFTKTDMTDEDGVATIVYGIEWPCNGSENAIFGLWTVVASSTVREGFTWDWLWFKVSWLVYKLKVTADPEVTKAKTMPYPVLHINVEFISFKEIPVNVLIHVVVMDNLQVPIGTASIWVSVGKLDLEWCTNATYSVDLTVPIPKWAFVGESTVECSALSNWPSQEGYAFCPEATTTFTIIKYTP
jgi:hypothetical protein